MRLNLAEALCDYEGKSIDQDGKELTLRDVFVFALNTLLANEQPTPEEKLKIFRLSLRLYEGDEAELSLDERMQIKERVGKIYNALIYGRIATLLEG